MIGVTIDITLKKKAEAILAERSAKLMTTSKMCALAEMASGIAHEINNPLTIIHGNAFILEKNLRSSDFEREYLHSLSEKICSTSLRIKKIIEGLQAFAHEEVDSHFIETPVEIIIEETLNFCSERFKKHGISLITEIEASHVSLSCKPIQITQILLNLLNNSHDALEKSLDKWVKLKVFQRNNNIVFSVTDSGPGVTNTIKNKIFEPFFTTKPIGKGTGLGLSISKGLAEAHGGNISLESSAEFTQFLLELPISNNLKSSSLFQ